MADARNPSDWTVADVLSQVRYCEETGQFHWAITRCKAREGNVAGSIDAEGYVKLFLFGRLVSAHRVVWFIKTGAWPSAAIDHINTLRADNRWSNLRRATVYENSLNRGKQKNNTSGYKGVSWNAKKRKWKAAITANSRPRHLGYFADPEAAHQAYTSAALKLHADFARAL